MAANDHLKEMLTPGRSIQLFLDSLRHYLEQPPLSVYPAIKPQKSGLKAQVKTFFKPATQRVNDEPVVFDERWARFMKNCEKFIIGKSLEACEFLESHLRDGFLQRAGKEDPLVPCVAAVLDNLVRFADRQAERDGYRNDFLDDVRVIKLFFDKTFQPPEDSVAKGRTIFDEQLVRTVKPERVDIDTMYFTDPAERHKKGEPPDFVARSHIFRRS